MTSHKLTDDVFNIISTMAGSGKTSDLIKAFTQINDLLESNLTKAYKDGFQARQEQAQADLINKQTKQN